MAIHFRNRPDESQKWAAIGELLGTLGGSALGYGARKLGLGNGDQQLEYLINAGISPEEARLYRSLTTPQEKSSFLKQSRDLSERRREQELLQQAEMGFVPNNSMGMEALGALGSLQNQNMNQEEQVDKFLNPGKSLLEDLEQRRDRILQTGITSKSALDRVSAIDKKIDQLIKKESIDRKEKLAERKFEYDKEKEAAKESKEFYDSFKNKARDARENNMRLGAQRRLIEQGKLVGPGFYQVMQKMNIPLDSASAEYEKLINDSIKNIKSVFGARITDFDLQSYMKTLAGLSTTRAGKLAIINNSEIANEATEIINKAIKQVIKKNGNKRPADLEEQVDELTKEKLDQLAEEYISGTRNSGIPEETWSEWAGRVLPGPISSAVGTAAKAAPGAIVGARLGGPWGAAIGGLLGAGGIGSILRGLGGE